MDRIAFRPDGTSRFGRKSLAVAGVIGLLAAVLLAFSAAKLPRRQREASRWVGHTLQVLEQAATLGADLATVASEGRGFLLDRTADSIGRFEAATQRATGDLADLRALTADNPAQRAALDRLDPLVAARINVLRELIKRVQTGNEDGAAALLRTQRGRALADQIRNAVQGFRAEERRLLDVRNEAERRAEWWTVASLAACSALAAASGLFMVALLIGRKRKRAHLADLHEGEARLRTLNEDLQRRAEEFQMLADNIPTLCWMAHTDGHIHWFNRRWYDYTGDDPRSQEGWGWQAAHDPDVLPRVVERWQHSLATGEPFEMTFPLKGANGVFRPFLTRVVPICDVEGRITCWFGTNTDITEQQEAEQALARHRDELERLVEARTAELSASEARYRLLTEHASDMVSRVGPDGTRLYVSPASARIVGVTPDALLGQRLLEHVVPEDRPALSACMQRLLAGSVEEDTVVYRVSHPQRGTVWVEGAGQVLRDPVTGALDGYVAVSRDITERRAAEAAREESEARYRLLADSTSDAITTLDLELRRTYVSPAFRALLGYEPEAMVGGAPAAIMHPEDAEAVHARLRPLALGAVDRVQTTYRLRHKEGYWVWVEVNFSLARNEAGRPNSIICTMRDVSERQAQADALRVANTELERLARHLARARDTAERASRAKSRFLAGMSHELRTPLNGILGYAELLRMEGGLSTGQNARVGAMLGAGQHLLEMINGVLDLSEIEEGHAELRPVAINLPNIANTCLDLVRPAAEAKGLALTVDMAPGTPCSMVADPTRLRQVLLNLLGNAVKFTGQGAVGLRIAVAGGQLRIAVADTGPGIPDERRHQLFQDFERLGAEAGMAEGAGLGLALSARLATLLGGCLGHADNLGGGSVFWLELPLTTPDTAPAPTASSMSNRLSLPDALPAPPCTSALEEAMQAASATATVHRYRVLVVDDMEMNRDISGAFLRAAGHEVACAEGGAEAVEFAAASDFDVVLMDVHMPGMDGLEATRRIRALAGPRGRVPIVALTAQAFAEQVGECRKAGMDSHLAKPFTPDALRDAVAHAAAAGSQHRKAEMRQRNTDRLVAAASGRPAGPASSASVAPTPPMPGSELPALDSAAFERTAAFLSPEALASYLQAIAGRGEALLRALHTPGALAGTGADLAAAAHTLAGSAGMFGFERLAAVARRFEHAVQGSASDAQALADGLAAAIKASLPEMQTRGSGGATEADSTHESGHRHVA